MTSNQQPSAPRLTRRSVLGLVGAVSVAAGGRALAFPQIAPTSPDGWSPQWKDLQRAGEYDQFLQQQAAQDQFSGNVLLAHQGRPVLARSYGMAEKTRSIPNTPDTLFALASVTKAMTATAVLQLVQRGQIALDATLGKYLSGFPAQIADTVTVHQMLTMTSGMGNYYYDPAWLPQSLQWATAAEVLDGTMGFIREQPLLFTPGSQYSYSNSGFVVLGVIVAQVSGQTYWDYMREHIFTAAGMARTDFYTRPQVLALLADAEIAHSYSTQRTGGSRVDVSGHPMFIGLPDGAGGPYTTASDMLGFAMALQKFTLLDSAYVALALNGKFPLTPPTGGTIAIQSWYSGYGLEDFIINDRHVVSHSGAGPGIATNLDIYPELNWVGVVLQNYDLTPFGTNPEFSALVELERQLITQQPTD